MATKTTNYGLTKPDEADFYDISVHNGNSDIIDTQLSALNGSVAGHTGNKSNPHGVTKAQVGLGNVENKSSATIRGELTKENVTTALGYTPPTQDTNTWRGIQNNLTSDATDQSLSAAQGKALNANIAGHTGNKSNPHGVTKAQVGLGNVENKSSATIRGELTKANVTTALGYTPPTTDTNTWRGIQNNLTSDSTTDSLSAAQGKVLDGKITQLNSEIGNLQSDKEFKHYDGKNVRIEVQGDFSIVKMIASGITTTAGTGYTNICTLPVDVKITGNYYMTCVLLNNSWTPIQNFASIVLENSKLTIKTSANLSNGVLLANLTIPKDVLQLPTPS